LGFDPEQVAAMDVEPLMSDPTIVRNRAKLRSAVSNARAFLKIQEEFGTFSSYQWRFVEGKPIQNNFVDLSQVPAQTAISQAFSKDLKQRGFSFLGPVVVYAHMQACGMVNDHVVGCFRHAQLQACGPLGSE
jgi:DNA-3-methyladenine glycosylase I